MDSTFRLGEYGNAGSGVFCASGILFPGCCCGCESGDWANEARIERQRKTGRSFFISMLDASGNIVSSGQQSAVSQSAVSLCALCGESLWLWVAMLCSCGAPGLSPQNFL